MTVHRVHLLRRAGQHDEADGLEARMAAEKDHAARAKEQKAKRLCQKEARRLAKG